MFGKRKHIFETSYKNGKYIQEFMDEYNVKYTQDELKDKIRYTSEMYTKEFTAFVSYMEDLGKLGVYPIIL